MRESNFYRCDVNVPPESWCIFVRCTIVSERELYHGTIPTATAVPPVTPSMLEACNERPAAEAPASNYGFAENMPEIINMAGFV